MNRTRVMYNYFRQYLPKTMKIVWQRSIKFCTNFLYERRFRIGNWHHEYSQLKKANS